MFVVYQEIFLLNVVTMFTMFSCNRSFIEIQKTAYNLLKDKIVLYVKGVGVGGVWVWVGVGVCGCGGGCGCGCGCGWVWVWVCGCVGV